MKAVIATATFLKLVGLGLLIFEIYLKNDNMELIERYINIFVAIFGLCTITKAKMYFVHIVHLIHFFWLTYLSILEKRKQLEQIDEFKARNLFMSFVVLFSSAMDEAGMAIESAKEILFEFRYILLNISGAVFYFVSLSLILVDISFEKLESSEETKGKVKEGKGKEKTE